MAENKTNERLASLEAKLEFLKELLTEIRDDLKDHPTRSEVDKLEDRVQDLESNQHKILIKVGITSSIVIIVGGLLLKFLLLG